MSTPIKRRTLLAGGAATVGLSLPGVAAYAGGRPSSKVGFTLNGTTLDGGEQVTSVTLHTSRLGSVDPKSLSTSTFSVQATATSPIPVGTDTILGTYENLQRSVTKASVDRHGNIVLDLSYGEGQTGGGTLGYFLVRARNVQLNLDYTITQNSPLTLRNRGRVTIKEFRQGELANPEVDAFSYHRTSDLKYRLFSPGSGRYRGSQHNGRGRPLVVWLHGGGEGASLPDGYYDNETTLRANRGALGFATDEAQRIFGGAYVVAPQSTSFWIEDGDRFAPQIKKVISEVTRRHAIDPDRIYVAGCSNGGYMTMKLTTVYQDFFAAAVPICGVVAPYGTSTTPLIPDAQLKAIRTPTWLVASADDTTVKPVPNTEHAHDLIPRSIMSLYDHVIWNGYQFPGHWSWIYVARNDPSHRGTHIWQWMARQRG